MGYISKFLRVLDTSLAQSCFFHWCPLNILRPCHGLSMWSKRGHLCLIKPDWDPVMDLIIHMDISRNPGPDCMAETFKDKSSLLRIEQPYFWPLDSQGCSCLSYTRKTLLNICKRSLLLKDLEDVGILLYRRK